MYQENVNSSHRHALRLVVTIATLLGVGSSTNLAAVDTINISYRKPLGDDQLAGSINPKDALLSRMFDFSLLPKILKEGH